MIHGVSLKITNGQSAPTGGKMKIVDIDEIRNRIINKYHNNNKVGSTTIS
jgi:hypothetical protein